MSIMKYIAASILIIASLTEAFTPMGEQTSRIPSSSLNYAEDKVKSSAVNPIKLIKGKKAYIAKLKTLDELKSFLQEDDRMAAIKFYAPWCKTCQRLGLQFQRLATEMGDGIASRKMVEGQIRFAEVAYSPETNYFIQDQLQVMAVPTLQLYHGLNKVWQRSGPKDTKDLREQVFSLEQKSPEELLEYAEQEDDGVLMNAIDDSLYDYPSFLDEEW